MVGKQLGQSLESPVHVLVKEYQNLPIYDDD